MTARINDTSFTTQAYDFQSEASAGTVATVQSGESTLSEVAKRLGVDLESLLQANPGLSESSKLQPGQDVRVPPSQTPQTQAADDVGPQLLARDSPAPQSALVASE